MTRIPGNLTRDDVLQALKRIDGGEPQGFRRSRKFDLVYRGRRYPPKAVLGLAARIRTGRALTPTDFTGGEKSRCHALLMGLGFEIVPKIGIGSDRHDAATAKEVIDTLLQDVSEPSRAVILSFLARSIQEAASADNDRWAVTLKSSHVRFNVGQTESIVLWSGGLNVLVNGRDRVGGTTLRQNTYPSAGGSRLRFVPFEVVQAALPVISASHDNAKALARSRPCTRVIKDAHSPVVVEYLWEALSMPGVPPVPTHFGLRRRPLKARERRAALLADKRVGELPDLLETERHVVIKQRLAQRLFRERLKRADCKCRMTGIANPMHLRASHIKPWRDCDDREKQDPMNGLLLAPQVDHLFDAGFLSFEDDGTVLVSRDLDAAVLKAWGLSGVQKVAPFSERQAGYLAYHRKRVFRS